MMQEQPVTNCNHLKKDAETVTNCNGVDGNEGTNYTPLMHLNP